MSTNYKIISIVLAVLLMINISACSKPESTGDEPLIVEREAGSEFLQLANEATAITLRNYIYARILTEEFLENEARQVSVDDAVIMMEELYLAWESADALAAKAIEITDQAVLFLETSAKGKGIPYDRFYAFFSTNLKEVLSLSGTIYAQASAIDRETWAENLAKQYDDLRGAKKYQQLAKQLGTDAKTAVEQMNLASKILTNAAALEEAQAETAEYNRCLNVVKTYKTASKVGLFVGTTIATGGGSLTSLAGSSMAVGKASAIVVGGVDCIVDVGETASTIVLGEDHQVTLGFQEASDVIQPASMVIGLVTLDPKETTDLVAIIGESIMEWFNPGAVTGIAVEKVKSGGSRIISQLIEAMEGMNPEVEKALNSIGINLPKQNGVTATQLKQLHTVNSEASMAAMEKLVVEIYEQQAALGEEPVPIETEPVIINGSDSAKDNSNLGNMDISGFYEGTATITAAKNDHLGEVSSLDFRITQNNNGTATFSRNELTIESTYNNETGELSFEYGFKWNLKFTLEGETIVARGTMTSDETGEGFTQEVTLDMKRTGD